MKVIKFYLLVIFLTFMFWCVIGIAFGLIWKLTGTKPQLILGILGLASIKLALNISLKLFKRVKT